MTAGFDYRFLLLNRSESVNSSYAELLVALVFAVSGVIVLASRNVHLHLPVCLGMVLIQVMTFFFSKKFETTERISVIKCIPLLTAIFTMLLYEPKKEKNGSINKVRSGILPVIKKLLTVASGAALTFSGLVALYQGGVLSADQKFFSYNFNYEKMFLAIGFVMLINGVLILFFKTEKVHISVSALMTASLIIAASFLLIRGIGTVPAFFSFIVFYMVIMFLSAICVFFVQILPRDLQKQETE